MISCYENGVEAISKIFAKTTKGLICTPYYSERGLRILDPFFNTAEEVEFWTRFSPLDWRAGVADMAALKRRAQSVLDRGKIFDIFVSDDLHAKIYKASDGPVIIGSANLTWPGMTSNIETICELTEDEANSFSSAISNIRKRLIPVQSEIFIAYVDTVSSVISKTSDGPVEEDADMNAAIELAEEELGKALSETAPDATGTPSAELEDFIKYCHQEDSEISREIIDRHNGKHSLQGHVKHCFYGSIRFLTEFPEFIDDIATTPGDSLYDFTDNNVRTQWRDFLRVHATEIDKQREFKFRTLRVYLPPTYGGICTGGGGGSGTLKRVLPVVARMIRG